ncbi:MAG TPA: hypothetical protein VJU18_17625 [Vicinamibacteria bacterium]|nr:hypothetical protein [Vicinamibacteria bacterium]
MEELTAADVDRRTDALLEEAEAYFMGEGGVHAAAAAIAERLAEAGIDYAIAGAIALGEYGFKRLTVEVDVLIRREDLDRFKAEWVGRGYRDVRPGGKAVRDTVNNVNIDFLLSGDFPGDGKPKPVAFPDPRDAAIAGERYRVLSLPRLVEMKLASGMTAPHRLQDLADVLRLIRAAGLPRHFAAQVDPYVRGKFEELWLAAQHPEDDY